MSDLGRALLADVCEHPDDDARRLVYADWLDDNGDGVRAEAIRLGVRWRTLDDLDPEAWVLDAQRKRLVEPYLKAWDKALPRLDKVLWQVCREGLADSATIIGVQNLRQAQQKLFAAGPVTKLRVMFHEDDRSADAVAPIAECPHADRLRHLGLHSMSRSQFDGLVTLARCPGLAGLRSLDFAESAYADGLLEALARCPAWPSLRRLNLYRGLYRRPGLRALAGAPLLASLRSLNLSRCHVENDGLRELLRSPHLSGLRELELSETGIDSRVIKNLVEYPWQRLERLDLSSNDLTAAGVRRLAGSARLASVRSLDLGGNHQVGNDGAVALAKSPHLAALVDLDVGWWKLGPRGVRALVEAPWMRQIRRLRLCSFDGPGLAILAEAELPSLRWLDLCYSDLTDDDLRPLLGARWLPRLSFLDLNNNLLTAACARMLAETPALGGVVSLNVTRNKIDDAGKKRLRQHFGERVEVSTSWD